jgi:16S rRNA (cytosine1402-N4)-methyltransferase
MGIPKITGGILFDLGASYHQLTKQERGFSFSKDAPLDMRFDMTADFSAYDVINTYKEEDLIRIFSEYGEERFSKRIAKSIVETRRVKQIRTTKELADIIIKATPRIKSDIHPATRVFQAVRIEVNHELQNVKNVLHDILEIIDVGGIISVLSFHSLEDRIVKQFFKHESQKCRCNNMICTCSPPRIELVNKKPITAGEIEIKENPPSRSAKLRIARCIN